MLDSQAVFLPEPFRVGAAFFIFYYFIFHLFQTLFNVDEKLNVVDKLSLNDSSKSNGRLKSLEGKLKKRNDWQGLKWNAKG